MRPDDVGSTSASNGRMIQSIGQSVSSIWEGFSCEAAAWYSPPNSVWNGLHMLLVLDPGVPLLMVKRAMVMPCATEKVVGAKVYIFVLVVVGLPGR